MDLRAQVEGIVAKIAGAVEELATQLESTPTAVAPDALERRCRDLGQAVAHEVLRLLWPHYGTGVRARRSGARVAAPGVAAAAAPGRCAIS